MANNLWLARFRCNLQTIRQVASVKHNTARAALPLDHRQVEEARRQCTACGYVLRRQVAVEVGMELPASVGVSVPFLQ
jgi:hypothetical protein